MLNTRVSMEMTLRTWWAWRPPVAPGNRYSVFHMIVIMERKIIKMCLHGDLKCLRLSRSRRE